MKFKMIVPVLVASSLVFATDASATELRPTNLVRIETTVDSVSSLATAPNGDIWVADWSLDRVQLFSRNASGSDSPLKSIALYAAGGSPSSSSDASSIAVDADGYLYVVDALALKIYVFNPALSDTQFVGNATRTINLGHRARSIALDRSGKIYAAGEYNSRLEVRVFEAGSSSGSSTPLRTFVDLATNGAREPYGLTILPNGEIGVSWYRLSYVRIYDAEASGDASPIRIISGQATNLEYNGQVISDSLGRLYVYSSGSNTIQIFAPAADGDVAPIASIGLYEVASPSQIPAVVQSGWGLTLGFGSQIWIGDELQLVHFNNPFTIEDLSENPQSAPTVDPALAAEKRQQAIAIARSEIRKLLASGKQLTVDQLLQADFAGVTAKNVGLVNADISKLPEADRTDIEQIEKVVLKFATVDKVAEGKVFYPADLIEVGLIPQDSKIKSSITSALKKLPASSLDSFEKIQAEVAAVEKKLADRKARLVAILAKKR